jgi:hypothetical protein
MFFEALERLQSIAVRHRGKRYTPEGLTHLIRMQFCDPKLRFNTERAADIEMGQWSIKGEYRPYEDEQGDPSIYITLVYPTTEKWCYINRHNWESMGFHIADIVTHEYIHQYYCRGRGYRYGRGYGTPRLLRYRETMQDYLGCEDEILAHGFNVASEMIVYDRPMEKTKTWRLYRKHFKRDPKVLTQLEKHTNKYLKRLERSNEQVI